jgi:hypothetical protein
VSNETKPTFTAEDLAHVSSEIAPYQDESLPAADRLKALTALAHGSEAEQATYARQQDLARELHRQLAGGSAPPASGTKIDHAAIEARLEEMRELAKLAHRDDDESRRKYAAAQPRMNQLSREVEALRRGEALPGTSTATPAKASAKEAVAKLNITDYLADLPDRKDGEERSYIDSRIWGGDILPWATKHQISKAAIADLGKLVVDMEGRVEQLRAEEQTENSDRAYADAARWAEQTYGAGWKQELERANQWLRRVLPNGGSKALTHRRLADGSALGSDKRFIACMVAIAREARR